MTKIGPDNIYLLFHKGSHLLVNIDCSLGVIFDFPRMYFNLKVSLKCTVVNRHAGQQQHSGRTLDS